MGCSAPLKELGLTRNDFPYAVEDGIWILQEPCRPGDDINRIIGNDDTVVDFEITNNRPDCYSIIGLAREAAAAFDRPMRRHEPVVHGSAAGSMYGRLDVEVPAERLCNRYTARMVDHVKSAPLPSGCASGSGPTVCGPSTTLWTSPTMSCWNTASRCTLLITATCLRVKLWCGRAQRARPSPPWTACAAPCSRACW